jgi:hypothetical protein
MYPVQSHLEQYQNLQAKLKAIQESNSSEEAELSVLKDLENTWFLLTEDEQNQVSLASN